METENEKTDIKISCVICTADRLKAVRKCLRSIQNQSFPMDEIIIVYGGNDSAYYRQLNDLNDLHSAYRVIWWPEPEAGCCHNFNIGIATARNEWVALIDDDAWLTQGWLARMAAEIEKEPSTTAIFTTKLIERDISDIERSASGYDRSGYICAFVEGASVYKKSAMAEIGFFDPYFICYGVCRHVAADLLNTGYRIKYLPEIETHHDKAYGFRPSGFSISCHIRNWIIYVVRYYSVPNILFLIFDIGRRAVNGKPPRLSRTIDVSAHRIANFQSSIFDFKWGIFHAFLGLLQGVWSIPWALRRRNVCRHQDFKTFFGRSQTKAPLRKDN